MMMSAASRRSRKLLPDRKPPPRSPVLEDTPVILIEDNRITAAHLAGILGAGGMSLRATARASTAVSRIRKLRPHLLMFDAALCDTRGLRLIGEMREQAPDARMIVIYQDTDDLSVIACVRAGVTGFVRRNAPSAIYLATLRAVADGATVLPPGIATELIARGAAR